MSAAGCISSLERPALLDRLEQEVFDVVVIGGGITGAGVAREAALRGLRVALLEAHDFAAGTSSRSSKLIHGGLRYLAMGDVALVRKAALERKQVFRLAPHLAERRWMVFPARSYFGLVKMRAGITTYEKLGEVAAEDRHRNWNREALEQEEPLLNRKRYKYACAYREYLTDDARLVLANLRDAARHGALAINYAAVDRILVEAGRACGVEAECRESGRRLRVRAHCIINAAGPWVEAVQRLEEPAARPFLHLSKGIHFAFPAKRAPLRNMLALNTDDGRIVFVIPRGSVVYVGTTDTTYTRGSQLWPEVTREDVEYLLAPLHRDLNVAPLRPEEITSAWAGLRPLIAEPGKRPSDLSRRDEILIGPAKVVTIAGGKLTGYRPMAKAALDKVAQLFELELGPPHREEPPLPGGDFAGEIPGLSRSLSRDYGLPPACSERLARSYGSEAGEVLKGGQAPLVEGGCILRGEVTWAVEVEGALTLEDLLYRRVRTALFDPDFREALVEPAADEMAKLLSWAAARRQQEVEQVRARLRSDLSFLSETG